MSQTKRPAAKRITAQAGLEIAILSPIGEPYIGAAAIKQKLDTAPDAPVTVLINSDGGDLVEGMAIYSVLRAHRGPVTTHNIALAASAASIVFMAGSRRIMDQGAALMVHESSRGVNGNADTLRKVAETLDLFDESMVSVYAAATGLDREVVSGQLSAETWLSADEAAAHGYATEVGPAQSVAAKATRPVPERFVFIQAQSCMDIRTKLGLTASATDEQVQAALDNLLAAQAERSPEPAKAAAAPDLASLVQQAVSDAFAAREAAAAAAAPQVTQQELHASACAAAVERFIGEGKIPPANRESAIRACGATNATLNACVAYWESAPRIVATVQRGPAPAPTNTTALSEIQKKLAKQAGMSEAQFLASYNKGMH